MEEREVDDKITILSGVHTVVMSACWELLYTTVHHVRILSILQYIIVRYSSILQYVMLGYLSVLSRVSFLSAFECPNILVVR